jgi:hypothetical protein
LGSASVVVVVGAAVVVVVGASVVVVVGASVVVGAAVVVVVIGAAAVLAVVGAATTVVADAATVVVVVPEPHPASSNAVRRTSTHTIVHAHQALRRMPRFAPSKLDLIAPPLRSSPNRPPGHYIAGMAAEARA